MQPFLGPRSKVVLAVAFLASGLLDGFRGGFGFFLFLVHFVVVDGVSEDELEIVDTEVGSKAFIAKHIGDELRLLVLEDADFLFYGISSKQAVGDNLILLADAVRAVDGLVLDGGVPPWIIEDDVRGGGEVESRAAGLQREHENGWVFRCLETLDFAFAVLRLAGEVMEGAGVEFEACLDEIEHRDELGEDEHLVA